MTCLKNHKRSVWQTIRLTTALLLATLCILSATAQSVDRTQLFNEILNLQSQLKTATDPVQTATLQGQLSVKEAIFLQPEVADFTANAAFLAQPDTGLIRILPRERFDGALQTRGGGAYYSFVRLVHEYGYGSDLSLEQGRFSVGFAGADFGFMTSLGSADLNVVTMDHPGVQYLAGFAAPLTEAEARQQFQRSGQGFTVNGFFYGRSQPAVVNTVYALRAISYARSDILITFRVARADTDGSQILQWKLLRWFSTPQLDGGGIASTSAASYKRGVFTRNSIVALFGNNLGTTTEVATKLPLPTLLAGTHISFGAANSGGKNVSLFAVTPGQANFLIPSDAPNGWGFLTITRAGGNSSSELIRIAPVAPGLFTANADGQGVPAAVALRFSGAQQTYESIARFDGAQNKFIATPIALGTIADQVYLLLFGTGLRERSSLENVSVKIGGLDAPVSYAGEQGSAGLDQINVAIPRGLASRGEVDVILTVDGRIANTVRINIK